VIFDYTFLIVVVGTCILGLVSGALGSFAVLRKQSLLGDAIAHAALPGIALAFLFTLSKSPLVLLLGAIAAGWTGTILMGIVSQYTTLKKDAILGIILSVFFGFGVVLLTHIQRLATASKSGLNKFLFGNASTLLIEDIIVMGVMAIVILILTSLFWKEFKIISFDKDYANSLGFPAKRLDFLLTNIIVLAIVIGLQTVGVVLMSAMVIAPAVAARQWTDKLGVMVLVSALFGATAGVIGATISSAVTKLPTGPTIVVVISIFVIISLLFAPNRGLIWAGVRQYLNRKLIRKEMVLTNMLLFTESEDDPTYAHDVSALDAVGRGSVFSVLKQLEKEGLLHNPIENNWGLTKRGVDKARNINENLKEKI
jgi:manganese/zinc/iron transport system permease protein